MNRVDINLIRLPLDFFRLIIEIGLKYLSPEFELVERFFFPAICSDAVMVRWDELLSCETLFKTDIR